MPDRRRRSIARRGSRKGTNWGRIVFTGTTQIAAASKSLLTTVVLSNPGIGETLVRSRGHIFVFSDQAAAVEMQIGAFGCVVVSDLAIAAGAASIPGLESTTVVSKDLDAAAIWVVPVKTMRPQLVPLREPRRAILRRRRSGTTCPSQVRSSADPRQGQAPLS